MEKSQLHGKKQMKKDDPSEVSNYESNITSQYNGESYEKIIHKHVFNFLEIIM